MKNIIKVLNLNIKRTAEENKILKTAIFSTTLLEIGIIVSIFKNRNDLIKFVLLAIIVFIICMVMLISIRLYETYIYINAYYFIYTVKEGDSLTAISEQFLPECNPWRTSEIIKMKNHIEKIYPEQKILIPFKKNS